MTSYRSNRFNCCFEGAAATIFHQEDIIAFLRDGVSHSNLKLQSVEADLQDQRLVTLLSAVALLYFRVTGPYWKLLKSDVPYTRFHIYVQKMDTLLPTGRQIPLAYWIQLLLVFLMENLKWTAPSCWKECCHLHAMKHHWSWYASRPSSKSSWL